MELYEIYIVLMILLMKFYGIPFYFLKIKNRVYYTLSIGTVAFYLFSAIFVYSMDLYGLNDGSHYFIDLIVLALFITLPFILIVNIGVALIYFLIKKFKQKKVDSESSTE